MTISAREEKWARRLLVAFRRRVSFELKDVDLLEFLGDDPFKRIARWCNKRNYSPMLVGLWTIKFSPNEMRSAS